MNALKGGTYSVVVSAMGESGAAVMVMDNVSSIDDACATALAGITKQVGGTWTVAAVFPGEPLDVTLIPEQYRPHVRLFE